MINTHHKAYENLTVVVNVINLDMTRKWTKEEKFTIEGDRYKELFRIPTLKGLSDTYFVKLQLKGSKGEVVSDNVYWFSSNKEKNDLTTIVKLQKVNLDISHEITYENEEGVVKVKVKKRY